MDDYDQYEKDCEVLRKENAKLLKGFAKELKESGIAAKTIKSHVSNIEFFLDNFLLYYEAQRANEGITEISEYLGDFFIRKCMWSNPTNMKQNAASFKKFYSYMESIGEVSKEELEQMNFEIKTFLPDWVEAVEEFNNPDDDEWF